MTRAAFIKACEAIRPGVTVDIDFVGIHRTANLNAPEGYRWDGDLLSYCFSEFHGTPVATFYDRALADFLHCTNGATLVERDQDDLDEDDL